MKSYIEIKTDQSIYKGKKNDFIFEIAITGSENRLLFVIFFNLHLVKCICQIQLEKMFSVA